MNMDLELAKERTVMAAQRTMSAWLRTGLTGIGGGFAIIRLLEFRTHWHEVLAYVIGQTFIVWGGFICLFAFYDYQRMVKRLQAESVTIVSPKEIFIISIVAFGCSLLLLLLTFHF